MQMPSNATGIRPVFPTPLSLPFRLIPSIVHNKSLVTALNKLFKNDLDEGELDFLSDRVVHIRIEDAGIGYQFTLENSEFIPADKHRSPDLLISGTVYDYLLLASRREDTDTLFFRRQLRLEGDTELGLYVKNFLDGLDMDSHMIPAYLESALQKSLPLYERLFG